MNSFTTFTTIGGHVHLSPNQYGNLFLLIALGLLVYCYISGNHYLMFLFWSFLIFGVFAKAVYFLMKKLTREITGEIIFWKEKIIINETVYDLNDIEKIEFGDLGNLFRQHKNLAVDKKSLPNGKDISLIINLKGGKDINVFFQLNHRGQMQDIRPQLVHYHNSSKLHFLNLIDILGIEDYNAIQIFKKSLPEGGDVKSY